MEPVSKYNALNLFHKIVDRSSLIDYLVAFGRVLENLGAFGRIFRSLFEYTGGLIQPLDRQNLQ